jgi:hypothetical protein
MSTDVGGTVTASASLFYDHVTGPGLLQSSWNITDESNNTGAVGYIRSGTVTSNTSAGRPGEIVIDEAGGFMYVCVSESNWIRATITATF